LSLHQIPILKRVESQGRDILRSIRAQEPEDDDELRPGAFEVIQSDVRGAPKTRARSSGGSCGLLCQGRGMSPESVLEEFNDDHELVEDIEVIGWGREEDKASATLEDTDLATSVSALTQQACGIDSLRESD
jgi:hypothetical protein